MNNRYNRSRHGIHNLTRPEIVAAPHRYIDSIAELGPIFFDEVGKVWMCSGYAESKAVLADYRRFSSTRTHDAGELLGRGFPDAAEVAAIIREQLLFTDPPKHNRVRDSIRGEFTKGAVEAHDAALAELVGETLRELPVRGSFDLVGHYAATFPPRLVTLLLGMPGREADVTRWADGYERLIGSLSSLPQLRDREVLPALRDAMTAFRAEVCRRHRDCKSNDLIATMTSHLLADGADDALSGDDGALAEHVIAANCLVLAAGGYQTLTHLITTGLVRLAENPAQREMLRTDPDLIDGAIDEFMRIDGSSQYVARRATEEIEIGGRTIAAGDTVLVHLAAANLDSRVFHDPKKLDITRREAKHLGFGLGRHYCAGAPLAERMARQAILGFLGRFDEYGLADRPDALTWGRHANTRCAAHAWVRTGPAEARETPAAAPGRLDRHRQLEEWNNTATPLPPHSGWHQLVEYWARITPNAPAVEDEQGTHSYRTLDRRANALAATLRSYNVQPGSVVGVLVDRSADLAVAALAIAKAGGALLFADPESPAERLRAMAGESRADLIIATPATRSRLDSIDLPATVLVPDTSREADAPPNTGANLGSTAYLVFTSGTTGRPKGIAIDQEAVVNLHAAQRHVLRIAPTDRVLQYLSPNFDGCFFEILAALSAGATLVVAPSSRLVAGPPLWRTLRDRRVSTVVLTPSVWAALPEDPLPDLRIACAAGERLPAPVAARWSAPGRRFLNLYGPAETAVWATWHEVTDPLTAPPIGRPVANKRVYVMDEHLRPLGIGQSGELCVGGTGVGRYLSRPDLMEERFAVDPFATRTGELMYRTGDVGRRLPDGSLAYLGRHDRQVEIRGRRVELEEIERVLETAPGVRECAVTAHEGRLTATVVPAGNDVDEATIRQYLAARLHTGMQPAAMVVVANLPRTAVGKREQPLVSTAVPAAAPAPAGSDTAVVGEAPALATWRLTRIFADCLDVAPQNVKSDTDFFSAGGDSLALSELIARTEEEFGVELDIDDLLAKPAPEALASSILGVAGGNQILVDSLREYARAGAPGEFPEVNDGEPPGLQVLAEGSGESGTVLLVHGTMDRATAFRKAATRLKGWTVVSYDRRGWAGSRTRAHDGLTLDDHVRDLVRALRTLPKPVVAGHSYGGLVALCAAARQPGLVKAVVAYEPPLRWLPWWPADEEWQRLVSEKVPDGPAAVAGALIGAVTGRAPRAKGADPGLAADGAAVLTEMTDPAVDAPSFEPATLEVPLVVAAGEKSLAHHREVSQRLADLAPNARFAEVPGARHIGHITHAAQFAQLVERAAAEAGP
jgi:amino acid adenylation domain-containing protein